MDEVESVGNQLSAYALSPPSTASSLMANVDGYIALHGLEIVPSEDGPPIIPTADRVNLTRCASEEALVHAVTPYLRRVYHDLPGREFYSSEQYPWLPLDGHTSTVNDHKPDTFFAFRGHVETKPPPNEYPYSLERMKFGIIPHKGAVFEDVNMLDFKRVQSPESIKELIDHMKMLRLGSGAEIVRGALCSIEGIYMIAIRADGKPVSQMSIQWGRVCCFVFLIFIYLPQSDSMS